MMRWIVGSSIKFRRLVIALSVGLLVYGVLQLQKKIRREGTIVR